jgi:hypothetical protein
MVMVISLASGRAVGFEKRPQILDEIDDAPTDLDERRRRKMVLARSIHAPLA